MTKIGVDLEIVKSGDKKYFMSPFRSFTREERDLFQNTIDIFHQRFISTIINNRHDLDLAQVQLLADGRIFDAEQAKEDARKKNIDVIIVDTAGRLGTNNDLMMELSKIEKVIHKQIGKPHAYYEIR